ncbi:hypothetical protein AUC68_11445 [Methyloceanibacter methanicus]|uniref:Uncharacterized protein n=1 Tax=Methyloceanibacter methanicus TaxID=1774968 RepID=A0A1E3VX64_9HYPH|nr:hypothetical protein AUC68_11445 [Methyloceanibacter methanicus]
MSLKAFRLPKLKFFAQPHKGDVAGDASVFTQALRETRTTVLIDRQNFGCAEECGRELIALIGVRCESSTKELILSTRRWPPASSAGASSDG